MRSLVIAALLLSGTLHGGEDDARAKFFKELKSVYDYLPADVTQEVREAKSAEMDRFWKLVAADTKTHLPFLREALRDKEQNAFFFFDGAALLIEHSTTAEDLALAVDALGRCRLKDISHKGLFFFTHRLGVLGANTTPVLVRMLELPDMKVNVWQHAMELNLVECMLFCAAVLPEKLWVERFTRELATTTKELPLEGLLSCLWYAMTPEAEGALRRCAANEAFVGRKMAASLVEQSIAPRLPGRTVTLTKKKLDELIAAAQKKGRIEWEDDARADAPYLVTSADLPRLRALRRRCAGRVSDEALYDLLLMSELIIQARKR